MLVFWNKLQESDHNVKGVSRLAKFYNIIRGYKDDADMFSKLQDISYPKGA